MTDWLDELPHDTIASVAADIVREERERQRWIRRHQQGTDIGEDSWRRKASAARGRARAREARGL